MSETKYVILIRNPSNGKVQTVTENGESEWAALYDSEEEAQHDADQVPICRAWPWCVVEAP